MHICTIILYLLTCHIPDGKFRCNQNELLYSPSSGCKHSIVGCTSATHKDTWAREKMAAISQISSFKCIFLNANVTISIKISLKFVHKDPINNIPALVQIMAWRRPGDKPLSEPIMVGSLTHICVTRPQWVKLKSFQITDSLPLFINITTSTINWLI